MVSDMNNAVPTALFSRRSAPVQIFLQAGLPLGRSRNLDAVFNSFGFDPEVAGWGQARIIGFNPPWDLALLDPLVSAEEIGRERAKLPQGRRLIGSYGRLAKVTEPYLKAANKSSCVARMSTSFWVAPAMPPPLRLSSQTVQ